MRSSYDTARGYAFKLDSKDYKDIVHDAYLRWFDKTGNNLFNEPRSTITNVVKYVWLEKLRKRNQYIKNGEKHIRRFVETLTEHEEDFHGYVPFVDNFEADLIIDDIINNIKNFISERGEHILDMLYLQYNQSEIAKEFNVSHTTINNEVIKIKSVANKMINNPFNGSRTNVKKRITESEWNKRTDKDEFELEAENEWNILYIHKQSKEGWLVKIKNPVPSEFYVKRLEDSKK